jgi:uncharacterized protein
MKKAEIISNCEEFVRRNLDSHDSGHDWWHIERVRRMALSICLAEKKGDPFIVEISALLHDIGDSKFSQLNDAERAELLKSFLSEAGTDQATVEEVTEINSNISFSKGKKPEKASIEFQIVQDADRLDAIGAIGIARAFNYGGFRNNPIFSPDQSVKSTVRHFDDKLLKLKSMMNTETGKKLAAERHEFMEKFLTQFNSELKETGLSL